MKRLDSFEQNKHSAYNAFEEQLKHILLVGHGSIYAVEDEDKVDVILSVSNKAGAEHIHCRYLQLSSTALSLTGAPSVGDSVLVLSMYRYIDEMFDSAAHLTDEYGKPFIITSSFSSYGVNSCVAIPFSPRIKDANVILKTVAGCSSLIFNLLSSTTYNARAEIYFKDDSAQVCEEETTRLEDYQGNLTQQYGYVHGEGGAEKEVDCTVKKIYGRYLNMSADIECGVDITIGKAHATPFADSIGAEINTTAPVSITSGTESPITAELESDVTLSLKSAAAFSVVAETGKIKAQNNAGSLKDVLTQLADLCSQIVCVDPAAVPAPITVTLNPALITSFSTLKTLIAQIFD